KQVFKNLFLSQTKSLHNTKELVFICYIAVFICILSTVVAAPSDLSEPWGAYTRLFHFYPFLFALVALCFNKFLPIKRDRYYYLRMVLAVILGAWSISIGFLNYSELRYTMKNVPPNISPNNINPLKIKGYSVLWSYVHETKNKLNFINRDMFKVINASKKNDMKLKYFFMPHGFCYLYSDNSFKHELVSDIQLKEFQKPLYYLIIGFNTGDFTEGYDVSNLKKLIEREIPVRYRHYVYEGIAVSLMNRRVEELIKYADFINKIPLEYSVLC
ncbi:hypothetical protein ACFL0P_07530, partial [Candidatus Omnitrophota bacterium]